MREGQAARQGLGAPRGDAGERHGTRLDHLQCSEPGSNGTLDRVKPPGKVFTPVVLGCPGSNGTLERVKPPGKAFTPAVLGCPGSNGTFKRVKPPGKAFTPAVLGCPGSNGMLQEKLSLLRFWAAQVQMAAVLTLLEEMQQKGPEPKLITYNAAISACEKGT